MRAVDDEFLLVHPLNELLSELCNAVVLLILAAAGESVIIVVCEIDDFDAATLCPRNLVQIVDRKVSALSVVDDCEPALRLRLPR